MIIKMSNSKTEHSKETVHTYFYEGVYSMDDIMNILLVSYDTVYKWYRNQYKIETTEKASFDMLAEMALSITLKNHGVRKEICHLSNVVLSLENSAYALCILHIHDDKDEWFDFNEEGDIASIYPLGRSSNIIISPHFNEGAVSIKDNDHPIIDAYTLYASSKMSTAQVADSMKVFNEEEVNSIVSFYRDSQRLY